MWLLETVKNVKNKIGAPRKTQTQYEKDIPEP